MRGHLLLACPHCGPPCIQGYRFPRHPWVNLWKFGMPFRLVWSLNLCVLHFWVWPFSIFQLQLIETGASDTGETTVSLRLQVGFQADYVEKENKKLTSLKVESLKTYTAGEIAQQTECLPHSMWTSAQTLGTTEKSDMAGHANFWEAVSSRFSEKSCPKRKMSVVMWSGGECLWFQQRQVDHLWIWGLSGLHSDSEFWDT